jgi:hypothetical protein
VNDKENCEPGEQEEKQQEDRNTPADQKRARDHQEAERKEKREPHATRLPGGARDNASRPNAASRFLGDGEGRNRTGDTTIFSRVLYQLSYLARGG